MRFQKLSFALVFVSGLGATPFANVADVVVPNDNRVAAGKLSNGVLTVRLEARNAVWRPEGSKGPIISTTASPSTVTRRSPIARCSRDLAVPSGMPRAEATSGRGIPRK